MAISKAKRQAAARKAARTRKRNANLRSLRAKKAARTRKRKAATRRSPRRRRR